MQLQDLAARERKAHFKGCVSANEQKYYSRRRLFKRFLSAFVDVADHRLGTTWTKFWVVAEPFELENMTFSRTVDGNKYLSCGECEREIIGIQLLPDPQVYVCTEKVKYI